MAIKNFLIYIRKIFYTTMKYISIVLFMITVGCAFGSKTGLQQYWKYSFENSIPSTNIIDIDYSQANEVAICLGTEVKYYTHDGTTYTESATIAETCTSVAIGKGPHLDDTSGDTQLMIGNSATNYMLYEKDGSTFSKIFHIVVQMITSEKKSPCYRR